MSFETRYANLNAAQKQAVDTIDGPVMVVAGPGTGKTELLSVRVANILQKTDTLPENILCLTFTESGQTAMRERLVGIIGKDAYKVAIHTFHSFGSEIMAQNREYFYQNALFQPADQLKQYEVLREIFESLTPDNPLSSMMNGEYTHLDDAKQVISELKRRSALTSEELLTVIQQNQDTLDFAEQLLCPILEERISKTTAEKLQSVHEALQAHAASLAPLYEITPLGSILSESLDSMLNEAQASGSTKPVTAWKNRWFERDAHKKLVFKDRKRLTKLTALSQVYSQYLTAMEKAGLFDFDDMIMQVVQAINAHDDLRFNLQEKYLYIMVDEFQDTNPAQLRILHSLTDSPVNEGAPNILVVGDDDQAIYGFQGADSSNILNFSDTYPTHKLVVLTENYRSGAAILSASRSVIVQAGGRLEDRDEAIQKVLHAQPDRQAAVSLWHAPSIDAERLAICTQISEAIKNGADPRSIAVLGRRHADIQALLPYLQHAEIPVRYERQESVLDSPPIVALELIASVVLALAEQRHGHVQELLPQLLAHPAWGIEPNDLWRLSLDAYTSRQQWMETMATTPRFVEIHTWLTALAQQATSTPLEPLIDAMIGSPDSDAPSPFFTYFFGTDKLAQQPGVYLEYLSALRAIRSRLREHLPGVGLTLKQLVDFIALHRRLGITITTRDYSLASDVAAVQLLTAHSSKGLEFDTVYVLHSVDNAWGATTRTAVRSIQYPENLPLQSGGNTVDERLRLFYVAMTRARKNLILSYSDTNDSGKQTLIADFLVSTDIPALELEDGSLETTTTAAQLDWYQAFVQPTTELKTLLAPQLEAFKLSATSLNSFLDVSRGGPQAFLLNNLLHFPKAKSPAAAYGTAVHCTMQIVHTHMVATGEQKPLEAILHDFEVALSHERLSEKDYAYYLQKGRDELSSFMTSGVLPVTTTQKAEVNFNHQNVMIDDAKLTGSLDVVDIDKDARTLVVSDYKTGKPAEQWDRGPDHTKLKLHKYRQQLLFYKLLAENSAEFNTYTVTHGQLAFIEPTPAGESIVLELDLSDEDIERTRRLLCAVWRRIMTLDLPDTSGYSPDLKGILAFEQDLIDETV